MLTRKQFELLRFIHERLKETGVPPSFDEMKDALDLRSKSGIHRLITALEERGFIRRLPNRARAIEVKLTEECATDGASEIPSDREGMRRLEKVTEVSPRYVGQRFYVFEGGCITVLFTISGEDRSEPLAVATQGLGAVPRNELRDLVRERSDGRLELDPAEGGRP